MSPLPFSVVKPLATVLTATAIIAVSVPVRGSAAQPPTQSSQGFEQSDNSEPSEDNASGAYADDEAPALGVLVGSCPGDAVCVRGTIQGSPADQAGLREGDYILSVDGQRVTSPRELQQIIRRAEAGREVDLTVWRQGEEINKSITLATAAEQLPASDRAWLGVSLSPADGEGVRIDQVMPASPAAQAGLRGGDVIVQQGDSEVQDVQSFIESVEDLGPDSQMELTILRDGQERQMSVRLGSVEEAPMRFLREARRPNFGPSPERFLPDFADPVTEQTIDQMRRQIRQLERQLQELQNQGEATRRSSQIQPADGTTLVVQRGGYGYRDWNRRYYGNNYYGNNYGWDNYSSRRPLYRSPYYGNRYYNYGGRPYYYNGPGYRYGYGGAGIQLGNFGVYWY